MVTLRDFNIEDDRDTERLAAMFNDFDNAWPGGFARGEEFTTATLRARVQRHPRLAMLIVEQDGEFVGYCDLQAQGGQKEVAYIPLLGARLSHHGKGVGKMLLREMVRRVTELGFKQVTLGTWAGNLKAVPLYKKTGFHWVPETNVWMRNFLPTVLTLPVGRAFFAERDWYACHEREIVVAPDDVKWKGMKVFPYRFRDGSEFLHLWFDADSEALTGLETPDYAVSCSIPVEEAAIGMACPVAWEIAPQNGKPLEVVLLAEADAGLELRVQERLVVTEPTTITREIQISPDAKPRPYGEPAYRVRSTLLINGQPVTLETGVKVVYPVEIEYLGQGLFPGREKKITVQIQSHLEMPLMGTLALDTHPAIACENSIQEFTLPARMKAQCEFTLTARETGVHYGALRFTAGDLHGSRPVAFRVFAGMGALASLDTEFHTAVLETPTLAVSTRLRGGHTDLHPVGSHHGFFTIPMAEIGPPFTGWRQRPPLYEVRLEHNGPDAAVTVVAPSQEFPGLVVERTATLVSGDLLRFDYRVYNTSDVPQKTKLRARCWPMDGDHVVVPRQDGVLREPTRLGGGFPHGDTDILPLGESLAESWAAREKAREAKVVGLIWSGEAELDFQDSPLPSLTFDLGEIPAHGVKTVPALYYMGGNGDWKTVRAWWRRLVQPSGVQELRPPDTRRVLEVHAEPCLPLLRNTEEKVTLVVESRRGVPMNGILTLTGEHVEVEPPSFALEGINRDRPFQADVHVILGETKRTAFLNAVLDNGTTTEPFRLPILRLCGSGDLRVSAESSGDLVTENGYFTLRVAPQFRGSLYAIERDGVNHLFTAYPEARAFGWANPWYGGVHPYIGWDANDENLRRDPYTGEVIERIGERGIVWRGAKVAYEPTHKDLRWLKLEVEYLTTAGSNVIALVQRWTNKSPARMHTPGEAGMSLYTQPGGTRENTIAHWERDGERAHRRRGSFWAGAGEARWAAAENPATRDTLLLIPTDPRAHAGFEDEEGMHLSASGPVTMEPNEAVEALTWLILCDNAEQIEAYAALTEVRRLP